eukprot:TRINITY_DN5178_c0_g1_i4.p1 TRINITY_DN5178_c0_g1~~TRINITY_DN5178_c0_g1_i4.p1  ORF type:complete len:890 (-),score=225.50 TRINITY_DN5178_c0_g1_i4:74-2743(-)
MSAEVSGLLPWDIVPDRYEVFIQVNPDFEGFCGRVLIDLDVKKKTRDVIFNAVELKFGHATLRYTPPRQQSTKVLELPPGEIEEDDDETAYFETPFDMLPGGTLQLEINYSGNLQQQQMGFFLAKYPHQGQTRSIAATQFEATYARRALPCRDEPAFKAIFQLHFCFPTFSPLFLARSNTPIVHRTTQNAPLLPLPSTNRSVEISGENRELEWQYYLFEPSPLMSTYLLAWVLGEYDVLEATTTEGVLVGVYVPPGAREKGQFALDVACRSMSYFHSYFGVVYPLPHVHLLSVPDFGGVAMENWGCVTFRDKLLVVDQDTSTDTKVYAALIIAHELAHQWFGNYVTMKWWSQLWLNEGFATFMQYKAIDALFPDWHVWHRYVSHQTFAALKLDALQSSHPIEVEVEDPEEIEEIFDDISYDKGSAVIRMIEAHLGADVFQQALHLYLLKHAYSNAVTEDLWACMTEVSGVDVKSLMDPWTKETGFPLLSVTLQDNQLVFRQHRFFASALSSDDSMSSSTLWQVPIKVQSLTHPASAPVSRLMTQANMAMSLGEESQHGMVAVKVNVAQTGLYRVCYEPVLFEQIVAHFHQLGVADRMGMLNDSLALCRAGYLSFASLLPLWKKCVEEETNGEVLAELCAGVKKVYKVIKHTNKFAAFCDMVQQLFSPLLQRFPLSMESKDVENEELSGIQGSILRVLCLIRHQDTLQWAKQRFQTRHTHPIPANLRFGVYAGAHLSDVDVTSELRAAWHESESGDEKERILCALGWSSVAAVQLQILQWALAQQVGGPDGAALLEEIALADRHADTAWTFVQLNWNSVNSTWCGMFQTARVLESLESPPDAIRTAAIEAFFADKTDDVGSLVQQVSENMRTDVAWLERLVSDPSWTDSH